MDIILALIDADISDRITIDPLGDIRIDSTDGSYIAVGSEPTDDHPDTAWWTATRYDGTSDEAIIYEGTDVAALIRTLAAA